MPLQRLVRQLQEAASFVDVGRIVCAHARDMLECHQTVVALFDAPGRLATIVDSVPQGYTDQQRRWFVAASPIDAQLADMLAHHAPIGCERQARLNEQARGWGYTGAMVYPRLVPLVGADGLLGYVRYGTEHRMSRALERDLDAVAAYTSAHLVRLGVPRPPHAQIWSRMPSREREVAGLAARGLTNAEIAKIQDISINTVKKHLKNSFVRLDVSNRAELSARVLREPPDDGLPDGVTALDGTWVTKAPRVPPPLRTRV